MGKTTIQELAKVLIDKKGLAPRQATEFATQMFSLILERLQQDEQVKIKGLGTFKIIRVEARESVSVRTGERVVIDSHDKVSFTPDALMKELVNRPFSQFETVMLNDGVEFADIADSATDDEADEAIDGEEFAPVADIPTTPNTEQPTAALPLTNMIAPTPVQEQEPEPQPRPNVELEKTVRPRPSANTELEQTVRPRPIPTPELEKTVRPRPSANTELEQTVRPRPIPTPELEKTVRPRPSANTELEQTVRPRPMATPELEKTVRPKPRANNELEQTVRPRPIPTPELEQTVRPRPRPTVQPEPFTAPEPESTVQPEPFIAPEPEPTVQPEPFTAPEPEPTVQPEPFIAPEPEPTVQPEPFKAPEPETVKMQETVTMQQENTEQLTEQETTIEQEPVSRLRLRSRERLEKPDVAKSSTAWGVWLLTAVGLLLLAGISALGGYYYGTSQTAANVITDTVVRVDTVFMVEQYDEDSGLETLDEEAAAMEEEAVAEKKPEKPAEKKPETPAATAKSNTKADQEKKEASSTTADPYAAKDVRVRLGAYRIVGLDREVKVQEGQTFYSICRAYLGPDMECYVEVYNDLPSDPKVKAGQVIKIPKLELKKRKR